MYELGKCYLEGIGVGKDDEQAAWWFRKGANWDCNATCALGKCYLEGIGVEKDKEQAKRWLHKAADKGNTDATELLRRLEQK